MSVSPSAVRSVQAKSATGVGCERCHCAPLENFTARTSTCAFGLSSATLRMCGMASRMAVFSA
jgi:hypothetical protein